MSFDTLSMGARSVPLAPHTAAMNSHFATTANGADESFFLLLELSAQEPTMQNCFKIVESTCLAQGIELRVGGKAPTKEFSEYIQRYYIPFCENAIRTMFTCGFVPWRLRKLSSGDPVPEVIPLGMFTWAVKSMMNHTRSMVKSENQGRHYSTGGSEMSMQQQHALASARDARYSESVASAAKCRTEFMNSKRFVPYQLQGDVGRLPKKGGAGLNDKAPPNSGGGDDNVDEMHQVLNTKQGKVGSSDRKEAVFLRQQRVLKRTLVPDDDNDTKILNYCVSFTENCGVMEDDVEIYEFIQPTNNVTYHSLLYKSISSPFSHILVDYRNMRQAMIRQSYADMWNTQAKLVCAYKPDKTMYNVNEGNPIVNDWSAPQNRLGLTTDTNLPIEIEQNAYQRDAITETVVSSKMQVHKPCIYTLPKNTTLEPVQSLNGTQDIVQMQVKLAKDIASIMGIPFELIGGGYSANIGAKKALENGRVFTTNMMSICRHLQNLLSDVYIASFGGSLSDVKFIIRATPRVEVNSVDELVALMDAGIVSFEDAMCLSNMLLGVDIIQSTGKKPTAGQFSRAYITPSNKKDIMLASRSGSKPDSK